MNPAADHGGRDGRGQVSVADQSNPRAGGANLGDQRLVPLALEHDDDEIMDIPVEAPRDLAQVVGHRRIEIDRVLRLRPHDQLLHVDVRRVEQPTPLGRGQHGYGPRRPGGAQIRPLQRVDGDVDLRQPLLAVRAAPDALADVQHRRLVALPFSNHDTAVYRNVIEPGAHRLHGDPIGTMAIAQSHRVRAGDRRLLDDVQESVGQIGTVDRHACTASR